MGWTRQREDSRSEEALLGVGLLLQGTWCRLLLLFLRLHALQHARLPSPSLSSRVLSNSYPVSWWCHPTISSSIASFSSCPQSFPASESFPKSWLFTSGGQSTGASASATVLSMNIQGWFPFRIDWFDLLAVQETLKSLLQHHSAKASVFQCSAFFLHTWLLEKP